MPPSFRTLLKFYLVLQVGGAVFLSSFPLSLMVWGIYNRHKINTWLILFVILMGICTPFAFYKYMDFVLLMGIHTPATYLIRVLLLFILGVMFSALFFMTRYVSFRLFILHRFEKLHERISVLIRTTLGLLIFPILVIWYHLFDKDNPNALSWLFPVEVSLTIWTVLIIFLFIRYPDDGWEAFLFKWFSSRFPSVDVNKVL